MSLSLPRWPTERRRTHPGPRPGPRPAAQPGAHPGAPGSIGSQAEQAGRPFALVHTTTGGERLYALNAEADRRGLVRGQALADAKALEPDLTIAPAAPEVDHRLLGALARGCGRWSPWTAPDPGEPGLDGILLEVTGCARLFGGEDALVDTAVRALRQQGYTVTGAIAPTIGLAWGLARFTAGRRKAGWVIADTVQPALDALPVAALRLGETAARIEAFGLRRVGELGSIPRAQLARRFGRQAVTRLDQARGQEPEVLDALQPLTAFRARLRFAEALLLLDGIKQAVHQTAEDLTARLETAGRGVTRLDLHLFRVDGRTHLFTLGLAAPAREARHITRLFAEKLDRSEFDIGFGIEMVELAARETRRLDGRQAGLVDDGTVDPQDLARLTDRLSVRLGDDSVRRALARQSHQPERAAGWQPAATGSLAVAEPAPPALFPLTAERPLLVLVRPEPAEAVAEIPDGPPRSFVWRRVRHSVHRAEGPERLAPDWWRAPDTRTRDYFRVETAEGRRFWLFRDGLYGLETTRPQWFVHGAT